MSFAVWAPVGASRQRDRRLLPLGTGRRAPPARADRRACGRASSPTRSRGSATSSSSPPRRASCARRPIRSPSRPRCRRPPRRWSTGRGTSGTTTEWMRAARAAATRSTGPCRSTRSTSARGAATRSRTTASSPTWSSPTSCPRTAPTWASPTSSCCPVMAHPFAGSWGYQVTSYFAPSPRWGSPDDFKEFVDRMHQNGIGVILDWVPAHFPRDDWALARFDGTALYEHADPRRGAHPDWGTLVFNFGRHEVRNFLTVERALLDRRLPRRRPPGRCRRLDALPRLLAQGRRVGAQPLRRPRGPRCGRLPQGGERRAARPGARRRVHRRGVHGLAGRVPADLRGRSRLRVQVEHGLDARRARLLRRGARSTAATTTTS